MFRTSFPEERGYGFRNNYIRNTSSMAEPCDERISDFLSDSYLCWLSFKNSTRLIITPNAFKFHAKSAKFNCKEMRRFSFLLKASVLKQNFWLIEWTLSVLTKLQNSTSLILTHNAFKFHAKLAKFNCKEMRRFFFLLKFSVLKQNSFAIFATSSRSLRENPLLVFIQTKKPSCRGELLFVIW